MTQKEQIREHLKKGKRVYYLTNGNKVLRDNTSCGNNPQAGNGRDENTARPRDQQRKELGKV